MSFNRKFKRAHRPMKLLTFPAQAYLPKTVDQKETLEYQKSEDSLIGVIELLWAGISNSPCQDLTKKDYKTIKSLKKKLREISQYKDEDKDSRITLSGEQILILEEEELSIMKKLLEANKFTSLIAEDIDLLYSIVDAAKEYEVPKPVLKLEG